MTKIKRGDTIVLGDRHYWVACNYNGSLILGPVEGSTTVGFVMDAATAVKIRSEQVQPKAPKQEPALELFWTSS